MLLLITILQLTVEILAEKNVTVEECVRKIYAEYVDINSQTIYMHAQEESEFINFDFPFLTYTYKKEPHYFLHFKKIDAFIIFINENTAWEVYNFLTKLETWNPRATTIIVFNDDLELLFKILSKYYIYNVIVLKQNNIYTYFPYKHENFNNPDLTPELLVSCDESGATNLYPQKLKLYWRNSTALVSYMPLRPYIICAPCGTGIEVELSHMLSKKLLFKLVFDDIQYNNWGVKMPNGTYQGAIRALQIKRADFVIGQFHLRERDHLIDFDYTFSYIDDDLTWGVPSAEMLSHWTNLINIFNRTSWISIMLSLIISAGFFRFLGSKTESGYLATPYAIEVPFVTILLMSPQQNPTARPTKILYLSTWVLCFICITMWNSYLIYALTHETYAQQITNTKELVESNLLLGIHPELAAMYKASQTEIGELIYSKFYKCDASYTCLDRVAHQRDMASITTVRIFKSSLPERYQTKDGRNIVDLVKESVVRDFTVMYFQKGHPLFERVNEALILLRSAGYIVYLDDHTDYTNALTHRSSLFQSTVFETKMLNMTQMKAIFYLLAIGCVIAGLFFGIEQLHFKRSKHNK